MAEAVAGKSPRPTRSLARDGRLSVAGAVVSNAATFLVALTIARIDGEAALGSYSVVFATRAILVLVCGLGMRIAMTKFVAAARARDDIAGLKGAVRAGLLAPIAAATLVGALLFLLAPLAAHDLFGDGGLVDPIRIAAVSLPFSVALDVALAASQGFQSMTSYVVIGLIWEPGSRLILTCVALFLDSGVTGLCAAFLASSASGALLAGLALRRRVRLESSEAFPRYDLRVLFNFATVSWVASLATQGILWADIVILGALVPAEQVGIYQVATRAAVAAMIVITPLTTAMAPRIAHYWEKRDVVQVAANYNSVVLWTSRLSLPFVAGLFAVPEAVMAVFGDGFASGVPIVLTLGCGVVVEAFAAPSAVLLNQIGRNRLNMMINTIALAGNIALNLILIPKMGIEGAAVAWLLALLIPGITRIAVVRKAVTGRWPVRRPHLVALIAAAASAGVGQALNGLLDPTVPVQLLLATGSVAVVYPSMLLAGGLTEGERVNARAFVRRRVRALGVRVPILRRLTGRWRVRSLTRGSESIDIDELISPHRSDILARLAIFELADQNSTLVATDMRRFIELAKSSPYRVWFDSVAFTWIGHARATESERERLFAQAVTRAVQLMRRFDEVGFDSHHPITVTKVEAGTQVGGRSLGEDRWLPVDGCHRLALLIRSGRVELGPGDYVVVPDAPKLHNTATLARAMESPPTVVVQFLARGLVAKPERAAVRTWHDLLQALEYPANRPFLEEWPEHHELGSESRQDADAAD